MVAFIYDIQTEPESLLTQSQGRSQIGVNHVATPQCGHVEQQWSQVAASVTPSQNMCQMPQHPAEMNAFAFVHK